MSTARVISEAGKTKEESLTLTLAKVELLRRQSMEGALPSLYSELLCLNNLQETLQGRYLSPPGCNEPGF